MFISLTFNVVRPAPTPQRPKSRFTMAAEVAAPVSNTSNTTGGTYPYYDQSLQNEQEDKKFVTDLFKEIAKKEFLEIQEVIQEYEQLLLDAIKTGDPDLIAQAKAELEEVKGGAADFFGHSSDEEEKLEFLLKQKGSGHPIELAVEVVEFSDNSDPKYYMQHVNAFLRLHAVQIEAIKKTDPYNWGLTAEYFDDEFETIDRVMSLLDLCHVV